MAYLLVGVGGFEPPTSHQPQYTQRLETDLGQGVGRSVSNTGTPKRARNRRFDTATKAPPRHVQHLGDYALAWRGR